MMEGRGHVLSERTPPIDNFIADSPLRDTENIFVCCGSAFQFRLNNFFKFFL